MSAVDEARALLATPASRRFMMTIDAAQFALIDAAPALIVRLCDEVERLREYHAAAEAYGPLAAQARRSAERALESWGGNDTAAYLSAEMTSREDSEAAAKALARLDAALDALAAKGEG